MTVDTGMQSTLDHVAYRGAGNVVMEQALRLVLRDRTVRPDWRVPSGREVDESVERVIVATEDAGKLAGAPRARF